MASATHCSCRPICAPSRAAALRVTPVATTFGELAEQWFDVGTARWRRSTQSGYRIALDAHLLPAFGQLALSAITPDMIAAFVARRLGSGAAGSYVAGNLRPLNGVFKLALRRGLVSANPMAALLPEERPKPGRRKRRTWTPNEIKCLVDAARELGSRVGQVYDYTPLIVLAIYTGMRVGELLGLRWQDVDLKDGVIRVRHQLCRETRTLIPPKTEAGIRDIPIPASLVGYLRRYRLGSAFSRDEHLVFCSRRAPRSTVETSSAAPRRAGLRAPGLSRQDRAPSERSATCSHSV